MGIKKTLSIDDMGDRMKMYESGTSDRLMPLVPVIARLDGKAFHSFTKKRGCEKPFDENFVKTMQDVTHFLMKKTNALAGYCQSDEITLMWFSENPKSQKVFFDRRLLKMVSVLAAYASVRFNNIWNHREGLSLSYPITDDNPPVFDCRVWVVPNKDEAANAFLWRIEDARTNSIQALAQSKFSHKSMQGQSNLELIARLKDDEGIDWNELPQHLRYGTFFQHRVIERKFSTDEMDKLPEKHEARTNPDLVVKRHDLFQTPMPDFVKVTNRVEMIFDGEEPTYEDQK